MKKRRDGAFQLEWLPGQTRFGAEGGERVGLFLIFCFLTKNGSPGFGSAPEAKP